MTRKRLHFLLKEIYHCIDYLIIYSCDTLSSSEVSRNDASFRSKLSTGNDAKCEKMAAENVNDYLDVVDKIIVFPNALVIVSAFGILYPRCWT